MYLHSGGPKAKTHGVRITSHPGPFNVLTSPHEHVVQNCVEDLTIHGDVFDMLGQSRTHYNKVNIHIGGITEINQSQWKDSVRTLRDYQILLRLD